MTAAFSPLQVIKPDHGGPVHAVAISPDGTTLASAGEDKKIHLHDALSKSYRHICDLEGHTLIINSICFSPDCSFLCSGSNDRSVMMWPLTTTVNAPPPSSSQTQTQTQEDQQQQTSTTTTTTTTRVIRLDRAPRLVSKITGVPLRGHTGAVWSVSVSADSTTIASASFDSTVRVWNVETLESRVLRDHNMGWVYAVVFSPTAPAILACGGDDKVIRLWNCFTEKVEAKVRDESLLVSALDFSPDGRTIAAASRGDRLIKLFDVSCCAPSSSSHNNHNADTAAGGEDGGDHDNNNDDLHLSRSPSVSAHKQQHKTAAAATMRSPSRDAWRSPSAAHRSPSVVTEGGMMMSSSSSSAGQLSRGHRQQRRPPSLIGVLSGHTDAVLSLKFSTSDFALHQSDKSEQEQGEQQQQQEQSHNKPVLVSGGNDRTLRLWDLELQQAIADPFRAHTTVGRAVVFHPSGNTVITGSSGDRTVRVWDVSRVRAQFASDKKRVLDDAEKRRKIKEASECAKCGTKFGFFICTLKHHCPVCKQVYCANCTRNSFEDMEGVKVNVCDSCVGAVQDEEYDKQQDLGKTSAQQSQQQQQNQQQKPQENAPQQQNAASSSAPDAVTINPLNAANLSENQKQQQQQQQKQKQDPPVPVPAAAVPVSTNNTTNNNNGSGGAAQQPPPSQKQQQQQQQTRPTSPQDKPLPASHRERLIAFYQQYEPTKLSRIDAVLEKYAGKEDTLWAMMIFKYGPAPEGDGLYVEEEEQQRIEKLVEEHRRAEKEGKLVHTSSSSMLLPQQSPSSTLAPSPLGAAAVTTASSSSSSQQQNPLPPPSPNKPLPASHRERLLAFYQKYDTSKIDNIDNVLGRYLGQEDKLWVMLICKYGPAPDAESGLHVEEEERKRIDALVEQRREEEAELERQAKAEAEQKEAAQKKRHSDATECEKCGKGFGMFTWKHDCSSCGGIFCDACSQQRVKNDKGEGEVRVCDKCKPPSTVAAAAAAADDNGGNNNNNNNTNEAASQGEQQQQQADASSSPTNYSPPVSPSSPPTATSPMSEPPTPSSQQQTSNPLG